VRGEAITLAEARAKSFLTIKEVGKVVGVTGQTISNWEHGYGEPTVSQGRRLASLYGVALEDVIFLPKKSN